MSPVEIVVVGASLGGLRALESLLGALPSDFGPPIVVAQHRQADGTAGLDALVAAFSPLPVQEVADRQPLRPGHVYLAPADYHVIVERRALALSTEGPVAYARPSIDVLFDSAAFVYAERVVGVVLTGASSDGAKGAAEIVRLGGQVIVEDPQTARSPEAPRATLARIRPAAVGPIEELAAWLVRRVGCGREVSWPVEL